MPPRRAFRHTRARISQPLGMPFHRPKSPPDAGRRGGYSGGPARHGCVGGYGSMDRSRDFFYPVAVSDQIGSAPIAASLLGERLALVRLGGELVAFRDLCVHRGTPLSMGRVEGDLLVCAYHGWNYDRDGACVRIPQRGPEHPIPRKARVERFRAEERYGAVWVCLGDPSVPLPGYPEYDDPAFRT